MKIFIPYVLLFNHTPLSNFNQLQSPPINSGKKTRKPIEQNQRDNPSGPRRCWRQSSHPLFVRRGCWIHGLCHLSTSLLPSCFAQCHRDTHSSHIIRAHCPVPPPLVRIWILQRTLSLSLFVEKLAFIFGLFYIYAYGRTTVSGTTRGSGRRTHPWVCEEIKRISAACSLAAAVGSYKRSTGELDELLAREELIDRGPA